MLVPTLRFRMEMFDARMAEMMIRLMIGIISSVGMNGIIYLQEWGDAQGLYTQRGRNLRHRDIPNRYMLMASRLDEKDEMD